MRPLWVYKKAPRSDKNRVPRGYGQTAVIEARSIGQDAAGRADQEGHQQPPSRAACWRRARACRPGWTSPPNSASPGAPCARPMTSCPRLNSSSLRAPAGTHVAERPSVTARQDEAPDPGSFMEMYRGTERRGRPCSRWACRRRTTFPAKLLARIRSSAVRAESSAPPVYPNPRGEQELRREIAALSCHRARHRVFAFADHHHRRLQQRPRAWRSVCSASKAKKSGSRIPVSRSRGAASSSQDCRSRRSRSMLTVSMSITA